MSWLSDAIRLKWAISGLSPVSICLYIWWHVSISLMARSMWSPGRLLWAPRARVPGRKHTRWSWRSHSAGERREEERGRRMVTEVSCDSCARHFKFTRVLVNKTTWYFKTQLVKWQSRMAGHFYTQFWAKSQSKKFPDTIPHWLLHHRLFTATGSKPDLMCRISLPYFHVN